MFFFILFCVSVQGHAQNEDQIKYPFPPIQEYIEQRIELVSHYFAPYSRQAVEILKSKMVKIQNGQVYYKGDDGIITELELINLILLEMNRLGLRISGSGSGGPTIFDCGDILTDSD